jgi:site-specific DNA-methyltransferase (adenine-specific)
MVSVNKGKWDQSKGAEANHEFNRNWLMACQELLTDNGTIWVSGLFF